MAEPEAFTFTNDLAELERLGRVVEEFGRRQRLSPARLFDLQLAVNEVFTNVVQYGFDDERPHEIVVRLMTGADEVVIEIEDDGRPFDPLTAPAPRLDVPLEERQPGGLGLYLARRVTDAMDYRRDGGRNIVRLRKNLGQALAITEARHGGVFVLRLHGRLDARDAGTLAARLAAAIDAGERRIVVEGERLVYVDSAGLQTLLVAAKRLRPLAGRFVLAGLQEPVRRIVDIAGLGSILRLYASESEAVTALA
jgi:serine/threonine-protein kinase RsbW